jgi:hypothetical protein
VRTRFAGGGDDDRSGHVDMDAMVTAGTVGRAFDHSIVDATTGNE